MGVQSAARRYVPGVVVAGLVLAFAGESPVSAGDTRSFSCGKVRCTVGQECCNERRCIGPIGPKDVIPDECISASDRRSCDQRTNEPCNTAKGETCKQLQPGGPLTITWACAK
jgi:hypothetical protein